MEKIIKAVAYARVSTLLGQDVQHQLHGIRQLAKQRDFNLVSEYIDEGISGTSERRPSLDRLIKDARKGLFSIIIIHSIDRLGRSTKHLLNLMDEFRHLNISIISIRESLDFSTPTGQMALTMLSAVAQLEAQLTSERIKTALAVKKALATKTGNGWRCGRPPLNSDLEEKVIQLRNDGKSIREISKLLGNISKSSVSRIIKEMSQKGVKN
jgi:DNA invertase Pin-like site-specific DNA recombinase